MTKKLSALALSLLLIATSWLVHIPVAQAFENLAIPAFRLQETTPVAPGTTYKQYQWSYEQGNTKINLLEIDLSNPYLTIDVIAGKGKVAERLNVSAMAREQGAVAAINGDFFNMRGEGAPFGPMVRSGELLSSPINHSGLYALGLSKDGRAYIDLFHFEGLVVAPDGTSFELTGLNKASFLMNPDNRNGHVDRLHLYDHNWGSLTRGQGSGIDLADTVELLIDNNLVLAVSAGAPFEFAPPLGQKILRGHGLAAQYLLNHFQVGSPISIDYKMIPDQEWQMVIGGHSLLVQAGKAVPYARELSTLDGLRARSALGISQDGQTLFVVAVEGRTEQSLGLRLGDLSRFFEHIGAWTALNLDGGGSTTMVTRQLGDWQATRLFAPEQAQERLVPNALALFVNAPQGELKGLFIQGPDLLLPGETVAYTLKAYDSYYNPVDGKTLSVQWALSDQLGELDQNKFTAQQAGVANIQVLEQSNSITATFPVIILSQQDLLEIAIKTTVEAFELGKAVPLTVQLTTKAGRTRSVEASQLQWQFENARGDLSPQGMLRIDHIDGPEALLRASYGNVSAELPIGLLMKKEPEEQYLATATVTGNIVNVRQGPGTDYDVIASIAKGTNLPLLDLKPGWAEVLINDSRSGWISREWSEQFLSTGVITGNIVNLRSGPGRDFEILTTLKKEEKVFLLKESDNWYRVITGEGNKGWMSADYVEKNILP
ncbi:SH3 domain-containing protein [Heliorestis acidaminivorans]|uniref:SH3 domain-containing protein n=1 Tax=Heliorestis acidaminivorans TaxID=553427 RepID=A0A6I0EXI7_9FIRM|nr:phosphodiester glycosidase family protein [Heliorestis acidaminivorans]KAB2951204.1 SH3 domain-containing protein [Heliorestis acidaminivorans]